MVNYIRCPRCDLNYINADEQEYCDVCLAEMKGAKLKFADLDEDEEDVYVDDVMAEEDDICPVCHINHLKPGETMCEECRQKSEFEEEVVKNSEDDEEWKSYLDEEDVEKNSEDDEEWKDYLDEEEEGEDLTIDPELIEKEFEEMDREEEENDDMYHGEDDSDEYADESYDLNDYDDDDDEDEDSDDDDDKDEF